MTRIIVILGFLLVAGPVMAAVTVSGSTTDAAIGEQTIVFTNTGAEKVRGIALDITVSGGAIITAVTEVSSDYTIYPGSIEIDPCAPDNPSDGVIVAPGSAVCDSSYYTVDTLGGIGTGGMTIEMASLYDGEANAPNQINALICKFLVDQDCTVTVRANAIRGGVVMEYPDVDPDDNLPVSSAAVIDLCCPCLGNLVDDTDPGDLNPVTVNDVFQMLNVLTDAGPSAGYTAYPGDPGYSDCMELIDTGPDGVITPDDAFHFINILMPAGVSVPCQPAPTPFP